MKQSCSVRHLYIFLQHIHCITRKLLTYIYLWVRAWLTHMRCFTKIKHINYFFTLTFISTLVFKKIWGMFIKKHSQVIKSANWYKIKIDLKFKHKLTETINDHLVFSSIFKPKQIKKNKTVWPRKAQSIIKHCNNWNNVLI